MKTCSNCPKTLGRGNQSGLCRSCCTTRLNSDPVIRAERAAAIRRVLAHDPTRLQACRDRAASARAAKTSYSWDSEKARAASLKGNAARPKGSPSRIRAGARAVATKLADLPPETHGTYLHLTKVKRLTSAEAKAMVLEDHQRQIERFRNKIAPPPPPVNIDPGHTPPCPVDQVAAIFGMDRDEITGPCRVSGLVDARTAAIVIMRRQGLSYTEIGRKLGGRDHTSVKHLAETVDIRIKRNPLVRAVVDASEGIAA